MSDKTGGPAFPAPDAARARFGIGNEDAFLGMNLHDFFAAHVDVSQYTPLANLRASLGRDPTVGEQAEYIAYVRLIEADAMIAARERSA